MTVGVRPPREEDDTASIISRSRNYSTSSFATTTAPAEKKKGLSALSGLLRRKQQPSVPIVELPGESTFKASE
jgi:hypothetical protein